MKKLIIYAAIIAVIVIVYKYATKTTIAAVQPKDDKKPLPPTKETAPAEKYLRRPWLGQPIMKNIKNGSLDEIFTPAIPLKTLALKFDTLAHASAMISGDATSLEDWNTFFDLPVNGTPFSNIAINGTAPAIISLIGGSNITIKDYCFGDGALTGTELLEVIDEGCIVECGIGAFSGQPHDMYGCLALTKLILPTCLSLGDSCFSQDASLTDVYFPLVTSIGISCFDSCTDLTNIDLPNVTNIGNGAFSMCEYLESFNIPIVTTMNINALASASNHLYVPVFTITIPALFNSIIQDWATTYNITVTIINP